MKASIILIFSILSFAAISQVKIELDSNTCSYYGEIITDDVYSFNSTNEAIDLVTKICNSVGLEQNFEIRAANVPNAQAQIKNGKRYIYYSQVFISDIESATKTKWSSISILAHEIGHHLNGHTLDNLGSRPDKELEADKFSGFVCYKLGATLKEAQEAMHIFAPDVGSHTHPPKSARLEAISIGWYQAKEEDNSDTSPNTETKPSTLPNDKPENNPPPPKGALGGVCFKNQNNYPREVVLTNKRTREIQTIILSNGAESCIYDLSEGTYSYKVYSVNVRFNGKVVTAQSQFKLRAGQTKNITLIVDNNF